jgi:hypothetical protein
MGEQFYNPQEWSVTESSYQPDLIRSWRWLRNSRVMEFESHFRVNRYRSRFKGKV